MKWVLIFIMSVSLYANDKLHIFDIGGVNIIIPEYNNMKDIRHIKQLEKAVDSTGGTLNKVITALYEIGYANKFPNTNGYPNRWATILIGKNIINYNAKVEDYISTVEYLKKNNQKIMDELNSRLPKETKAFNDLLKNDYNISNNITFNVPKLIPNTYIQGINYYGYVYLLKIDNNFISVGVTSIIYLKGKLLTMNIYYKYNSKSDIDNLMKESKLWLNEIYRLNKS